MSALMLISMRVEDEAWMKDYFEAVPELLAEYGAVTLAATRRARRVEGEGVVPDRVALMRFPSSEAIDHFMADERYQPFRSARQAGARTDIIVFENAVKGPERI